MPRTLKKPFKTTFSYKKLFFERFLKQAEEKKSGSWNKQQRTIWILQRKEAEENSRTAEQQNSGTAEQQNSRTAEQQNSTFVFLLARNKWTKPGLLFFKNFENFVCFSLNSSKKRSRRKQQNSRTALLLCVSSLKQNLVSFVYLLWNKKLLVVSLLVC